MLNKLSDFAATLRGAVSGVNGCRHHRCDGGKYACRMLTVGDSVVKYSLASLVGLLALAVYLVLVPLMVFFLLKDKEQMLNAVRRVLPRNRSLAERVWKEMNQQITNYIRGKVLEMIVVSVATWIGFISTTASTTPAVGGAGGLLGADPLYWCICGDHSGGGGGAVSVWRGHRVLESVRGLSDYSGA